MEREGGREGGEGGWGGEGEFKDEERVQRDFAPPPPPF